ncbi:VOC family protein [Prescottella agglutinans]
MAIGHLGSMTMDCADPDALARFWCENLGGSIPTPARSSWD